MPGNCQQEAWSKQWDNLETCVYRLPRMLQRTNMGVPVLFSLSGLVQATSTRDDSTGTGSDARGEGMERDNLQITTLEPIVAQRAGGISAHDHVHDWLPSDKDRRDAREWFGKEAVVPAVIRTC